MNRLCEPHSLLALPHPAFAVYTGAGDAASGVAVCKDVLDMWLDYADEGRDSEPTALEFLEWPPLPVFYDNDMISACRCHITPMPPCGPCENGEVDPDA